MTAIVVTVEREITVVMISRSITHGWQLSAELWQRFKKESATSGQSPRLRSHVSSGATSIAALTTGPEASDD
jgi:hypothetical protein